MQTQESSNQETDLVKATRIPPVDEPIADRIREDFLKPRMFVPQHMVAQCRPVLVPISSDDPILEGYPNVELKGQHARYVVPPVEDFSVNRQDRVFYPSENVNETSSSPGLFGDYIRSFSLRHKNKNMTDEEALAVTYPLYHIDKRYSEKSIKNNKLEKKTTRKSGGRRSTKKNKKRSKKYR